MSTIHTDVTVGELVVERPARSRVFERLGIDYCCGGKKPLEQACSELGLDPEAVTLALATSDEQSGDSDRNWADASMTELVDHILDTHHAYLRDELPRLSAMTAKVRTAHQSRRPETAAVNEVFEGLRAELESHMAKEEQVLFPILKQMEAATSAMSFHCGSVMNPIRVMEHEHDNAGQALTRLRELTGDYRVPDDACNTYRAMLDGLQTLEKDLHQHIHKENNILFPKAVRCEAQFQYEF